MLDTNFAFYNLMMETEGLDNITTTRTAKINAAINDFVISVHHGWDINEYQEEILKHHGLSYNSLTVKEKNYIKREVERRV